MWTDQRLDDLSRRVDAGFERVNKDIRELRGDVNALRHAILQVGGGLAVGLVGVIVSILLSGV